MSEYKIRNVLHAACGQRHDSSGRKMAGWDNGDRVWPLPAGHRPPDYQISPEWVPIYSACTKDLP